MLFLAHRAPHDIRASQRIAGKLAEDLHDLLLIDDTAVGDVEDGLKQRMLVGDGGRVMAVADIGRNRVHRPGTIQRDNRDQILKSIRL